MKGKGGCRKKERKSTGTERYLSTSSCVLGRTAGNEFCIVVLEEIFVEAHVLFFGENGIVGLEAIFLQHGGISGCKLSEWA